MNSFPNITVLWIAKVLTKVKNETPEKNLVPLIICSLGPPVLFFTNNVTSYLFYIWHICQTPKYIQSNLHVRPPLVSDHLP